MKNLKRAFSLPELLLSIAIIGIVSAMGMTVAKHGTDRAFDQFYYNGYISLYNAIAENGVPITAAQLGNLLESTVDGNVVTASNGITYNLANYPVITMTVPQRKTRTNNGVGTVQFRYMDEDNGYLVPLTGGTVNLQDRRDLLVAYIDNGVVGRMKRNTDDEDETYEIVPIAYYSYRQAVCELRGGNVATASLSILNADGTSTTILDCSTLSDDEMPSNNAGVLKFANPKRVR